MRVSMILWLFIIAIQTIFAQNIQAIRPIDLVQARQQVFNTKTPKAIFTINTGQKNLNLETYEFFDIDEEKATAIQYEAAEEMLLELPRENDETIVLQLVKVSLPSFTVIESASQAPVAVKQAIHYRGIIAGDEQSIVALSIVEGEVMGLISSDRMGGNWVLAKLPETAQQEQGGRYALYRDKEVFQQENFSCSTADSGQAYDTEDLRSTPTAARNSNDCIQIYLEVNYDIYQDKGSIQATVQYITALFNQVATLFANEQINMSISEVFVWNTPSPYNTNSSGQMLTNFQNTRSSFNGDLAQLLSYQASGGIAVVDGLCHPYTLAKMSYAGINSSFQQIPTYSWSVMVMAHELGHLLGSQHTHACVWNGNGTAIDACPGYTEGGCGNPAPPVNGGTIMSYCHLSQIGINLSQGFGLQPGNLIRSRVGAANCLTACSTGGGNGGGGTGGGEELDCNQEQLILRLRLDTYSPETTWSLKNAAGAIIAQGGPYPKTLANQWVLDTFCLPQGCYNFQINDAYNDGICCDFGDGSYTVTDVQLNILSQGNSFTNTEQSSFCVPFDPGNGGNDCQSINFSTVEVVSYGANQDQGQYAIQDDGQTLYMANNAWKAVMMDYEITPNTRISFDFKSTKEGEIHGIGFDNNNNISYGYTFRVFGIQNWGLSNFDNYPGNNNWKSYTIPVGEFYVGTADRLFFCSDHDGGARNGNAFFRNVRIYEGTDCNDQLQPEAESLPSAEESGGLYIYPNPATNGQIELRIDQTRQGNALWQIISLSGQVIRQENVSTDGFSFQQTIAVNNLPRGAYLIRWQDGEGTQSARFSVQ